MIGRRAAAAGSAAIGGASSAPGKTVVRSQLSPASVIVLEIAPGIPSRAERSASTSARVKELLERFRFALRSASSVFSLLGLQLLNRLRPCLQPRYVVNELHPVWTGHGR